MEDLPEMDVILDFCANCGILLHSGVPCCENCNMEVKKKQNRLQGTFSVEDALKFQNLPFESYD